MQSNKNVITDWIRDLTVPRIVKPGFLDRLSGILHNHIYLEEVETPKI